MSLERIHWKSFSGIAIVLHVHSLRSSPTYYQYLWNTSKWANWGNWGNALSLFSIVRSLAFRGTKHFISHSSYQFERNRIMLGMFPSNAKGCSNFNWTQSITCKLINTTLHFLWTFLCACNTEIGYCHLLKSGDIHPISIYSLEINKYGKKEITNTTNAPFLQRRESSFPLVKSRDWHILDDISCQANVPLVYPSWKRVSIADNDIYLWNRTACAHTSHI